MQVGGIHHTILLFCYNGKLIMVLVNGSIWFVPEHVLSNISNIIVDNRMPIIIRTFALFPCTKHNLFDPLETPKK